MPILVNSTIQVSFKGTWEGQRILLTQNYKLTATTSANTILQDLATLGGYFALTGAGSFLSNYLACLPTNYTCDFVRTQVLSPFRSIYWDTTSGAAGTFPAIASTGNLQYPITLYTPNGDRDGYCVKKIGPAPDTTYSVGEVEPAFKAGPLQTFAIELTQQQVTLGSAMTLDPIVMAPDKTGVAIVGYRLSNRVGTMRSRTVGVGE